MKNTLGDLNNHLFAQLERLSDEEVKGEALKEELDRAKGVSMIATQVIQNGNLVLRAQQMAANSLDSEARLPKMLEG